MKKRIIKTKIFYLGVIILIATAGTIFFFPLNIGGEYTCFYHRLFDHSHPVSDIIMLDHHQEEVLQKKEIGNHGLNDKVSREDMSETSHLGSDLLDNYLHQYAFPWWASIGLLAFCIYLLSKLKRNIVGNDSDLTVKQ